MIIDGKIKVKNDAQIERFTKTGLRFTNGTEVETDVVMFATGYVNLFLHASGHSCAIRAHAITGPDTGLMTTGAQSVRSWETNTS